MLQESFYTTTVVDIDPPLEEFTGCELVKVTFQVEEPDEVLQVCNWYKYKPGFQVGDVGKVHIIPVYTNDISYYEIIGDFLKNPKNGFYWVYSHHEWIVAQYSEEHACLFFPGSEIKVPHEGFTLTGPLEQPIRKETKNEKACFEKRLE